LTSNASPIDARRSACQSRVSGGASHRQVPSGRSVRVPGGGAPRRATTWATERAVAAGAHTVTAPATHAFGQGGGRVRDPFGNIWWISAVVEDVAPDEGMRRLAESPYAEAMPGAQETLDRELSGRTDGVVRRPVTS
jgi:hypothetical protein